MAAFDPPKFKYPPEWEDKERMAYLLAPIPPNRSPASYGPKITFWASLIKSSSQELQRPVFTERELQIRFKWNDFTSPRCLSNVISSMESAGEVIKMSEIRQSVQQNVGWVSWGVGMIKKPVSWALRSYLSSSTSVNNVDEEYVVLSAIKELANRVVTEHQKTVEFPSMDRVVKYSSFVDMCKTAVGVDNVSVVEMWLLKENKIVKAATTTQGEKEVVKFCTKGDMITETDVGILSTLSNHPSIKESIDTLSNQVRQLQEKSTQLKERAVEQFKAKNKNGALKLLRQQKVAQASLEKREGALDNLQNILHQIQMAESDAMIYKACKSGAEVLKQLRESSGFTVDDIDEVAMNLQDALEANQEISEALKMVSQEAQDEDSLEAELMELLKTDQSEVSGASLVSPRKQVQSATEEDDLEARLASLTLGARQQANGTADLGKDQIQEKEKSQSSTKRLKLPPLPA